MQRKGHEKRDRVQAAEDKPPICYYPSTWLLVFGVCDIHTTGHPSSVEGNDIGWGIDNIMHNYI